MALPAASFQNKDTGAAHLHAFTKEEKKRMSNFTCNKLAGIAYVLILSMVSTVVSGAPTSLAPSKTFGDHMVLQREMPVPVWGEAAPGKTVTVSFAGQKKSAKADKDGKWKVVLAPLKASKTGQVLTISSAKEKVVFKDVLVGEVWICTGQSNMQLGVNSVADLKKLVSKAQNMPIRTCRVGTFISLTPLNNCEQISWTTSPPGSAVAFGFAYYLQKKLKIPVGIILTCWGSSSIEGWMPLDLEKKLPSFKKAMDVFNKKSKDRAIELIERARKSPKGIRSWQKKENIFARSQPNILYNAMMHPLIPYAIRGMVWYQGEANTRSIASMREYQESLKVWIARLRQEWGENFHLLVVMLPGFGKIARGSADKSPEYPDNGSWAWMREAQLRGVDFPNNKISSVANTIDLGDERNIHPRDKKPLCERLALLAEKQVYGEKVEALGPVFDKFKVKGKQMVITFSHADGLKTSDGSPPKAFWLADKSGNWKPATAEIKGNTVVLTADGIKRPVACRYAFAGFPQPNLVNKAGLPAYPFRTDDFPPPGKK